MRRLALQRESAELRDRLHLHAQAFGPVWHGIDGAWEAGRWLRGHPWVPAVALLLLAWRRPRRLWLWGRRGWAAWTLLSRVRQAWAGGRMAKSE
jgi:YqjK-like protein